jgi:predicted metal-binding membrane protein
MATMAMATQWTAAYAGLVLLMWAVMMLAMMLPAAAPVVLVVALIARRRAADDGQVSASVACFVLGYAIVWGGLSVGATALQWRLATLGVLSAEMQRIGALSAGVVLAAVGLNQWTPLKRACLRHCRSPLDFLLLHWRDGPLAAVAGGSGTEASASAAAGR